MKNTTTCIVVDEDEKFCKVIEQQLKILLPSFKLIKQTSNGCDAICLIKKHKPDIVFITATIANTDSFSTFRALTTSAFALVVTSYDAKFALKAIKANATDYLLKPIQYADLVGASLRISYFLQSRGKLLKRDAVEQVQATNNDKLSLKIGDFYELVSAADIVCCKSHNNYTEINLKDSRKVLLSKTLKHYENQLKPYNFCRIHQRFLINIDFIKSIEKGKSSHVILRDGTTLGVAQSKKETLFRMLGV